MTAYLSVVSVIFFIVCLVVFWVAIFNWHVGSVDVSESDLLYFGGFSFVVFLFSFGCLLFFFSGRFGV